MSSRRDVALLDQGIPSLKSRFVGRAHLNSRHDWENMPARPRRRSGIVRTIIARAYCAGRRHRVSCRHLNSRPLELRTYLKKVMRFRPTATASERSGVAPTGSSRAVSCIIRLPKELRGSNLGSRASVRPEVISSIVRRQAKALIWRKPAKFFLLLYSGTSASIGRGLWGMVVDWDLLRVESLSDNVFAIGILHARSSS